MRWFKHYSDNYRGRSVAHFNRHFGHTGIAWYYLLMEICTEKMQKLPDKKLSKDDCKFSFDWVFIRSSLRGNRVKIESWLGHGQVMGLWSFTSTRSELSLEMPILLDLLDSDSRRSRSRRDSDATESRLDIDIDKDIEEDKEYIAPRCKQVASRLPKSSTVQFSSFVPNDETMIRWVGLYDQDYVHREFIKISNWLDANPKKNRRTERGWLQFVSNWLERGWASHLAKGRFEPSHRKSWLDQNNEQAIRELEEKYGELS